MSPLDSVSAVLNMSRTISLLCVVALAAGCSQATPQASSKLTPPRTTLGARAAIRTLPPVVQLTAACTLLSPAELEALLGGGASRTRIAATEDKPNPSYGNTSYTCEYGTNSGKNPFTLTVLGSAQTGYTPNVAVDAFAKGRAKASVAGVGEAAAFFAGGGHLLIAVSKRSHGQIRTVIFAAPAVVPERMFIDVAELVISRI